MKYPISENEASKESIQSTYTGENTTTLLYSALWCLFGAFGLMYMLGSLLLGKDYFELQGAELVNGQKIPTITRVPIIFGFSAFGIIFFIAQSILNDSTSRVCVNQDSIECQNFLRSKALPLVSLQKVKSASLFDRTAFILCFTKAKLTLMPRWHGAEFCRAVLEKIQKDHPNVHINNTLQHHYNIEQRNSP